MKQRSRGTHFFPMHMRCACSCAMCAEIRARRGIVQASNGQALLRNKGTCERTCFYTKLQQAHQHCLAGVVQTDDAHIANAISAAAGRPSHAAAGGACLVQQRGRTEC